VKAYIGPRPRWWLPLAAAGVLLIVAGVGGYTLAQLVAVVASAQAPRATLAPAAPAPSLPISESPQPSATASASPTVVAATSSPSPRIHIVQPGEYVTLIAQRYGVTPQAILRANNIPNPNYIEVGQQLIIPNE
jgi:LysM repeat protein